MRTSDYRRALDFIEQLHPCRDPAEVGETVVRGLPGVIAADHVSWDDLALSVPIASVTEAPRLPDFERRCRMFATRLDEHPCLRHWLRTGDMRPYALSDFLSPRALEHLPIYQELFRPMGYADQLGMCLTPPRPTTRAVALGRSRRGFTEEERALLERLRPHIAGAYDNAATLERASRRARAVEGALGLACITATRDGRIIECPERAERWLRAYYPEKRVATELPITLRRWLRSRSARDRPDDRPQVRRRELRRGDRYLVIHLCRPVADEAVLVLEERSTQHSAAHLRTLGLTRREIEVLMQVERGLSNREIAAALCISPRTVTTHLEHVYAKLGVTHRAAAVARLRGLH